MSSPTSSGEYPAAKRRKMSKSNGPSKGYDSSMQIAGRNGGPLAQGTPTSNNIQPGSIPKRGARACTACRKGKNRCEGEVIVLSIS